MLFFAHLRFLQPFCAIDFLPTIIFEAFSQVKCHWGLIFLGKMGSKGAFHSLFHLLYFKGVVGFPFAIFSPNGIPFVKLGSLYHRKENHNG